MPITYYVVAFYGRREVQTQKGCAGMHANPSHHLFFLSQENGRKRRILFYAMAFHG